MGINLQRALVLFEQSRYDLAEKELQQELSAEPESSIAHSMLAICFSRREAYAEATAAAEKAVALEPDSSLAHYGLARILLNRERYEQATQSINEALRLDPDNADYYGVLSSIRYEQKDWKGALEAADSGLQRDPEQNICCNLRGMALIKLGRNAEADQTLQGALARAPENSLTHANQGWSRMESRDYPKAMEHFREALRLNPQSERARQGIVEAMKARHFLYSLVLSYFLWTSRLSMNAAVALFVGSSLGYHGLSWVADHFPVTAPVISVVKGLVVGFAFLTLLARPVFNLVLRLDKVGRLALSQDEIVASNVVGAGLFLALAWAVAWIVTGQSSEKFGSIFLLLAVLPLAGIFDLRPSWQRRIMAGYTIALYGLLAALLFMAKVPERTPALSSQIHSMAKVYLGSVLVSFGLIVGLQMVKVRK